MTERNIFPKGIVKGYFVKFSFFFAFFLRDGGKNAMLNGKSGREAFSMVENRIVLTDISFTPTLSMAADGVFYQGTETDPALGRLLERCKAVAKPKAVAVCLEVSHDADGHVTAIGDEPMRSIVLDEQLKNLHRVFAYVTTCGTEMANVDYEGSDELRRALLSFCLGGMHSAMDALLSELEARYHLGKTGVLNPGSLPEWPLSEQPKLFRLLGNVTGDIGVTLEANNFMSPLATSSGLLFETEQDYQNCSYCTNLKCVIRRAPYEPEKAKTIRG